MRIDTLDNAYQKFGDILKYVEKLCEKTEYIDEDTFLTVTVLIKTPTEDLSLRASIWNLNHFQGFRTLHRCWEVIIVPVAKDHGLKNHQKSMKPDQRTVSKWR